MFCAVAPVTARSSKRSRRPPCGKPEQINGFTRAHRRSYGKEREKKKVLTREPLTFPQTMPLKTDSELSVVGQPVSRTDGRMKVTGKLAYGADYPQEDFLHGKILRSPHPHARIKSVQIDKAKELPGVAAVLTAKDVPGRNGFGVVMPDQPVICGDKVRFVGDAVALVAAETEAIAQKALSLIEVEYEPLPAVFDPREALKPGASRFMKKETFSPITNCAKATWIRVFPKPM